MPLLICILIGIFSVPFFSLQPFAAVAGGLFLFFSGLEINLRQMRGEVPLISKLWLGAFVPSFIAGLVLPHLFPHFFASPDHVGIHKTAFILGIALSVSAVPVVIKIMEEIGWAGSVRSRRVIFTAVLCDVVAWLLFFFVLPSEGALPWLYSHWSLLMFFVGLAVGYLWPGLLKKASVLFKFNKWIVAPVFFIGIGQALNFKLGINIPQLVLLVAVATISKTGGVWAVAKYLKLAQEEVRALSLTLNARGAMEIILAKFALNAGVINDEFFVSLVIMALGTSLVIKPLLALVSPTSKKLSHGA